MIFSKLESRKWPDISKVAKICCRAAAAFDKGDDIEQFKHNDNFVEIYKKSMKAMF